MDLQLAGVADRITESDQTGDEGLDAGTNAEFGNVQQHNDTVGNTDADGKQLDGLFPEQIDQCHSGEDGNALEQKL